MNRQTGRQPHTRVMAKKARLELTGPPDYQALDAVTQFRDAITATGSPLPDSIIPDGELHRFPTNNRSSDTAGWYVLHVDGIPAGAFGDFRTDLDERWRMDIGRELSATEQIAMDRRMVFVRQQRDEALTER
jgi:putative DNA primase/helicase